MNALAKKALLITRVKSRPGRDGYCEGRDWSAQRAHLESVDTTQLVCRPHDEEHIYTNHSDTFANCGSIFINIYFHTDAFIELLLVRLQAESHHKCQSYFGLWKSYRPSFRANTDIWHIKNSEYWPTQSPSPLWNIHFVTTLFTQWRLKWRSTDATSTLPRSHPASFKFEVPSHLCHQRTRTPGRPRPLPLG